MVEIRDLRPEVYAERGVPAQRSEEPQVFPEGLGVLSTGGLEPLGLARILGISQPSGDPRIASERNGPVEFFG